MKDDIINNGGYNPSNQDNLTSTACGTVSFSWKLVNIKSSVVDSGVIFQSANLKY